MKKLKRTLTAIAICFFTMSYSTVSALENEPSKNQQLRSEIVSLIGNQIPIMLKNNNAINVEISFMLNTKNEIVIINIDADNQLIDAFIKNKLNYQIVKIKGIKKGEIYRLPLVIESA